MICGLYGVYGRFKAKDQGFGKNILRVIGNSLVSASSTDAHYADRFQD
jgi:hypothetical protein